MPRTGAVQWDVVEPSRVQEKWFRLEALNGLRSIGRRMRRELKRGVQTWERDVKFELKRVIRGEVFSVFVYTEDRIYAFINNGTSVRYATMTPDFVPKTQVGSLDSGPGRGGLLFVNTNRPRPGIDGRHFDEQVEDIVRPIFFREMERRLQNAIQKSGHAI